MSGAQAGEGGGESLRQMHPVGVDHPGQLLVGAHQKQVAAAIAGAPERSSELDGGRIAKGAEHDATARREPRSARDRVRRPHRVGEQQQRRQHARMARRPAQPLRSSVQRLGATPLTPTLAHAEVLARMQRAATAAGRSGDAVTLVAVSKQQPWAAIRPVLDGGQRVFGENRVQEAAARWAEPRATHADLELRLIGPLQTNKAQAAVALLTSSRPWTVPGSPARWPTPPRASAARRAVRAGQHRRGTPESGRRASRA
jgi:hypothetical protein